MVVYDPRESRDKKRTNPRNTSTNINRRNDARTDLELTRTEIYQRREERRKQIQKKKQRAHLMMGGVLISSTLCAVLLIVWFSIGDSLSVTLPVANAGTSTGSNLYGHDMPEPPIYDITQALPTPDDTSQEVTSSDTTAASNVTSSYTPYPESTQHQSVTAGEMAFTPDEISELEEIIKKGEAAHYYTLTSSDNAALEAAKKPSASSSTSSKYLPPPEYRSLSIYFEDLTSGYTYSYNADQKYFIASLIKAPYCMYLYTLAEEGECDLNERITVEYRHVQAGTGAIAKKSPSQFPFEMTVRELMREAIRSSDNTAMELLRKKYPHTGYQTYATSLGLKYPEDVKLIVNGSITAGDAGVYLRAINEYINNGKYGKELREDMLHTTNPIIRANYPIVRKYGWADRSFHDMGIIEAPQPYILAICSDAALGTAEDHALLGNISKAIAKFQQDRISRQ